VCPEESLPTYSAARDKQLKSERNKTKKMSCIIYVKKVCSGFLTFGWIESASLFGWQLIVLIREHTVDDILCQPNVYFN